MKLILDPTGTAIDLAKRPLWVESIKVTPGKKKVDLLTNPYTDGAVPFGKSATDVMVMEIDLRVDEKATLEEALAELRNVSQLLDEIENQLPAGMALEETPDNSETPSTAYVLLGEIVEIPREMSGDQLGWYHKAPFARLVLTCEPFYEGPEEIAGSVEGETPLLELTINDVKGDVPALALITIEDKAGVAKRHHEIGLESRYFDKANPRPILIETEGPAGATFETAGYAGVVTETAGAYSLNGAAKAVAVKATLYTFPIIVCATGDQKHIGSWREKLRWQGSSTNVYVRLAWQIGDGPWDYGEWVKASAAATWLESYLETLHIDQASYGTQRWRGRIEAYSTSGEAVDTVSVDYLQNMPSEQWMQASAPTLPIVPGTASKKAPGTVASDAAEGGKVWTTPENAKASDNAYATCQAAALNEPVQLLKSTNFGFAIPGGATILGIAVTVERKHTAGAPAQGMTDKSAKLYKAGVLQATNKAKAGYWTAVDTVVTYGGSTDLWGTTWTPADINNANFGFGLSGVIAFTGIQAAVDAVAITVFFSTVADPQFVIAANRKLLIDHEVAERFDSTGTYTAPVPEFRGAEIELPPAGDRARSVRVVSKQRVNDVDAEADTLTQTKHKVTVSYRPRYRFPIS